jgi:8-oxo-dGTP pyrophosphatase MutT (NUDIX family)
MEAESPKPFVCLTAAGTMVFDKRVLLVRHRGLGIWLSPGGHIDPDELPHEAAEREFYEETGIEVEAIWPDEVPEVIEDDDSRYVPNPIASNLHWISRSNYTERVGEAAGGETSPDTLGGAPRPGHMAKPDTGCEQHLSQVYLVQPLADIESHAELELHPMEEEVTDIGWFTRDEIEELETKPNIRYELQMAFDHMK